MMQIICWIVGHDMQWRREPVRWSRLSEALGFDPNNMPTKLAGTCARCRHETTAIPPEITGPDPEKYPELARFVRKRKPRLLR